MQYGTRRRPRRRRLKLVVLILILVAIGVSAWWFTRPDDGASDDVTATVITPEGKEVVPGSIEGRYLFSGTIVLARAVENEAKSGGVTDYAQPFSGMSTLSPESYDAWAADFECPSTSEVISYRYQIDNLVFNCPPEFLPELKKYFDIVSLANNHSSDMGYEGFLETQRRFEEAGIQTYGNYNPAVEEDICEIITLPIRLQLPDDSEQTGTLPMAFCAWHYFSRSPLAGEIDVMKEYAERMPVFGFMHVGVEYVATAGADQASIAHQIIDGGAEFVIGNSPHWVQNSEVYKGKPIFYSTGNFIFDQLDSETNRGLSVDVSISAKYDDNLAKWLALGESCKLRADTCLEEAEKQGLRKYDLDLEYAPIATSGGYRNITKKASEAVQKSVETRLNWSATLQQLQAVH